ncbi:hypothetical protein DYB35_003841 [Aphanomyces astaci]|uniref:Uncharacterized protein n=1 Tax=Aphanomyces astaci TaxID=112090 RepID=A0A418D805_APHAT|nr:hypothetical protein DYB35_003841 [Aphanomyces astaci]
MKGAYLFAVLVGIKTILAEIQAGERATYGTPINSYDNQDEYDNYGDVEEYDQPSYGGDVEEYDQPSYGDNVEEYDQPSYGGDDVDTYETYGDKEPTNDGYEPKKADSYTEDDYNYDTYSEPAPTKRPTTNKPAYGYGYDDEVPSYKTTKKPAYKPRPNYGGDNYGQQETDDYDTPPKSTYGKKKPASYNKEKPGYGNIHGDKFGDEDDYRTYAPPVYEPWTSHYKKDAEEPFPYTFFTETPGAVDSFKVPKLGDYHCFLTGAPWTSCGRKSLTNYFLDQCLVLHFSLSANVDGICGGEPPKPTPKPEEYNDDYYGSDYKKRPTPEPTTTTTAKPKTTKKPDEGGYGSPATAAPTPKPATYEITPDYLKEKCLQSAYVSITTATVMCLTENYIRINFIEHYAADACKNPVEGPVLYLRKLHAFIESVKACTGDAAKDNFPNLYRSFEQPAGTVAYNPNAPYYVKHGEKEIFLQQYTSGEASGLSAFTIGTKFACANPNDLQPIDSDQGAYIYANIPSTIHYSVTDPANNLYTNSKNSEALKALQKTDSQSIYRYCQNADYTTDRTYRGLYDAVHYVEREASALRRPQSIAEIAVRSAGYHEQPILEGFGILYYCAFHACRANNDGDLSKCYPEFKTDEWKLSDDLRANSATVTKCIDDDILTAEDITTTAEVQTYNHLLSKRSYLCLAEFDVVEFLGKIYPDWAKEDDAISLVYGRHLADERAYGDLKEGESGPSVDGNGDKLCPLPSEVYAALSSALSKLAGTCSDKRKAAAEVKPHVYNRPQYGNPQYGSEAKYGGKYTA